MFFITWSSNSQTLWSWDLYTLASSRAPKSFYLCELYLMVLIIILHLKTEKISKYFKSRQHSVLTLCFHIDSKKSLIFQDNYSFQNNEVADIPKGVSKDYRSTWALRWNFINLCKNVHVGKPTSIQEYTHADILLAKWWHHCISNSLWKFPLYAHERMKVKEANHVLLLQQKQFWPWEPLERILEMFQIWWSTIWEPM